MASIIFVNSVQSALADTIEIMYTSPSGGQGSKIEAFAATNVTASSKTYAAHIYDSSGTALPAVIAQKVIVPYKFDLGASLVGQLIPPGGTLRLESSDATSVSFRVTGVEL